jgi:anaerobic ribonucleoside-triphosphate reductase activating protein
MDLRLARIHYPITVLGPGRRVGVWVQGCSIGCRGCMSQDTWPSAGGNAIPVAALVEVILAARDYEGLVGVTISGGEPFEQPEALLEVLLSVRSAWPDADILIYSGYSLSRLRRVHSAILDLVDAAITEPFVAGSETDALWRGSANQVLTTFSDRARDRYAEATRQAGLSLQVGVDDQGLFITGVPRRGDLDRVREMLVGRGLRLDGVSWAP